MITTEATKSQELCQKGKEVLESAIQSIQKLIPRIDEHFAAACDLILNCKGRVAVIGIGKSGHISKKIAATLSSTGTPSYFVHPSEAGHGDLGMIVRGDVALMLSNSGETPEMLNIVPLLKQQHIAIIAMTGNCESTLAQQAYIHLHVGVEKEAGTLGLAPTSSTTAALVMGDALAITLLETRGFTSADFALNHPGGSLGKRLLLTAFDLMHKGKDIPMITQDYTVSMALVEVTSKRLGLTLIVDNQKRLLGIFTDGDLRRSLDKGCDIFNTKIEAVMNTQCHTIEPTFIASHALQVMRQKKSQRWLYWINCNVSWVYYTCMIY